MSYYDYRAALEMSKEDPPFYALIMAAMLKADTENTARLKAMWPETWSELDARYHAPGGVLPSEAPLSVEP